MTVDALSAWLVTYAIHSSVLLGAVWLTTRAFRGLPDGVQETLWKVALIGGLLTSSWQCIHGTEPVAGSVPLPMAPAVGAPVLADAPAEARGDEAQPAAGDRVVALPWSPHDDLHEVEAATTGTAAAGPAAAGPSATSLALLGYAALVLASLGHLWLRRVRFWRGIADRELIVDGEMPLQLLRLTRRAGYHRAVRLTHSERVSTPIAFGHAQPEICVPSRAVRDLGASEQEGMLAHELAHLLHRDPAWLLFCQVLQRLLFVQPLHLVAHRRLRVLAEYRCDAWAAAHARDRLSLARCLVAVAGWIAPRRGPSLAPAMATRGSELRLRVDRILEEDAMRHARVGGRRIAALAVALLVPAGVVLPNASWRPGGPIPGVPAADSGAEAPLPAVRALPLPEALVALDEELTGLEAELAAVREGLGGREPDPRLAALLAELERHAERMRQRRSHLRSLLTDDVTAHRAGAGDAAVGASHRKNEREHP